MSLPSSTRLPPRRKRFIPNYDVPGVYKVTLGDETQHQIEMAIGFQINAQYPWKMVSKAKIMENINVGVELSEFYTIREHIEDYPEEELLMGYIVDESKNIDEFYVCCTTEARDHCSQQSQKFIRRQEKKLEKAVQKKPRPWVSLGSEAEISELEVVNTRNLMELEIKAKFPTEYQPEAFHIRDTEKVRDGLIELTPYRQKFNNVYAKRVDCGSQITCPVLNNVAQTQLRYPQNKWTQSIADVLGKIGDIDGSGDAGRLFEDLDDDDISSDDENILKKESFDEVGLIAYRNAMKLMRRKSYIKKINKFVYSKSSELESMVELNAVMDMYYNDYQNLVSQKHLENLGTMVFDEYVCFTDVRAKEKYVSCATFHPMWSGIVAISYADVSPTVMKTLSSSVPRDLIRRAVYGLNPVMIWSHIDSLIPKLYLEAPREVKILSFCPFNENILIGGLINGQVLVWDLTHKLENVEKIEVLSETREKYRIAMNAHMGWMKPVQDRAVVSATACSNLMTCHLAPVTGIKWVPPNYLVTPTGKTIKAPDDKSPIQFMTTSEDGTILIWDISVDSTLLLSAKKVKKSKRIAHRPSDLLVDISPLKVLDRILQPIYKIIIGEAGQSSIYSIKSFAATPPNIKYIYTPRNNGSGRKYFTCEIQELEGRRNDVYVGTQTGGLTRATWEGHEFNTGEVVNAEFSDITFCCNIHDGPIVATHKNPNMDSVTLTVGGKIFAIWSDQLKGRPIIWKRRPYRLTDGVWSQYKPSVLFLANSEGALETWDLVLISDKPVSVQTLSGTMLTGVSLHTLPLNKNILGVSDVNGSFRLFIYPPVFMLVKPKYMDRMKALVERELKVIRSYITWQADFVKKHPNILLDIKHKEGLLLAEKEEERRKAKEELEKQEEEENEAKRLERLKYIGPEERWQKTIQKLIERTIAVKKRIDRALLFEQEKPLRELEAQRLVKARRMLEIMKNQKAIFNDTVAILFPEAIKKPLKPRKSLITDNKPALKKEYIEDYKHIIVTASKMVRNNPYIAKFSWESTFAEGKERRACLFNRNDYVKLHFSRIEDEMKADDDQYDITLSESKQESQVISSSASFKKSFLDVI
ncbi:WD repeat-containing protein 63-like [Spodoptera litura]|uniref:WD repeat-containing protein 63-like n=1 Tax=Spodoptera litura TaxID=69820 RepID=A0A9J7ITS6_SPOLT|nr:WD repeat-containing protein 63-like [Spodoptera litura]